MVAKRKSPIHRQLSILTTTIRTSNSWKSAMPMLLPTVSWSISTILSIWTDQSQRTHSFAPSTRASWPRNSSPTLVQCSYRSTRSMTRTIRWRWTVLITMSIVIPCWGECWRIKVLIIVLLFSNQDRPRSCAPTNRDWLSTGDHIEWL